MTDSAIRGRPRAAVLSFLIGVAAKAGNTRAAELYLAELMSLLSFRAPHQGASS